MIPDSYQMLYFCHSSPPPPNPLPPPTLLMLRLPIAPLVETRRSIETSLEAAHAQSIFLWGDITKRDLKFSPYRHSQTCTNPSSGVLQQGNQQWQGESVKKSSPNLSLSRHPFLTHVNATRRLFLPAVIKINVLNYF